MAAIDITKIPFNRDLGMIESDRSDAIFMFPAHARYHNHLGTVHAAVLFTLAEATSGEFLQRHFTMFSTPVAAVVRRSEVKYRRPAVTAIHSRAKADPASLELVVDQLARRGRAGIAVEVDIVDEDDRVVMTATFEWFATTQIAAPNL
jgi:acyl-coenzyme A thioesterase PaaI-like protein